MADNAAVVHIVSNTPEEVAFKLLGIIGAIEQRQFYGHGQNPADRKWVLETYHQCLMTVKGIKPKPE